MNGLKFIIGEIGCGKSYELIGRIRSAAEKNANTILIVPEQFSSAAEQKLYNALGIQLFNRIHVETFSRIKRVLRREIHDDHVIPDDAAKAAVMYAVRRELADAELKCYGNQMKNPAFTSACIKMARELELNGITPEMLSPEGIDDSVLAAKLSDISRICTAYSEKLNENNYTNAVSDGMQTADAAARCGYFKGCEIFIDQFKSFTADQKMLIDIMKAQGHVTIAMPTPYSTPNDSPVFSAVNENINRLDEDAEIELINSEKDRYANAPDIRRISRSALRGGSIKPFDSTHIHGAEASNIYDEAEYVCAEISRLVRSGRYKYSDIAVLSRDFESVKAPLEEYFRRYDIPYFADSPACASSKPLMIFILTAVELAAREKPTAEMLLRLMKTGCTPVDEEHISELEKYYTEHGIIKESWEYSPVKSEKTDISYQTLLRFDNSADKSGEEYEMLNEKLENTAENAAVRVNIIRSAVMKPLAAFRKACGKSAPLKVLCSELCLLTERLCTAKKMRCHTERTNSETGEALPEAREAMRIWKALDTALRSLSAVKLNERDDMLSLKDLRELLAIIISQISLSSPAQSVNCVTASAANRARLDSPKVVFIMSAVSGMFPFRVSESSIFTEHELEKIEEKLHIRFAGRIAAIAAEENFIAVSCLAAPSEELYITYPLSGISGNPFYRSTLADAVFAEAKVTPVKVSELPNEFFITTDKSAYFRYVRFLGKQGALSASETKAVKNVFGKETAQLMESAEAFSRDISSGSLLKKSVSSQKALRLYTGKSNNLKISASRIEDFAKCPFMFFCEKGLKLRRTQKLEFAGNVRGTAVHSVLYMLLKMLYEEARERGISFNELFAEKTPSWLKSTVAELMEKYTAETFTEAGYLPTPSFKKSMEKQGGVIYDIVLHMQREFDPSNSRFSPAAFEYAIGESYPDGRKDMPAKTLTAATSDGIKFTVSFTGSVDRIDIFTDSSSGTPEKYLRVVDYKTGTKVFRLEEIAMGINMQMLLYLYAVTDGGRSPDNAFGGYFPAGIMYMPSRRPDPKTESTRFRGNSVEKSNTVTDQALRMNGLTLNTVNVVRAMEFNAEGRYINPTLYHDSLNAAVSQLCTDISVMQTFGGKKAADITGIDDKDTMNRLIRLWAMLSEGYIPAESFEESMKKLLPNCGDDTVKIFMYEKPSAEAAVHVHRLALIGEIYCSFDTDISADTYGTVRSEIEHSMTEKPSSRKNGAPTKFPSEKDAVSPDGMKAVLEYTKDKLTQLSSEICSGNADIAPLEAAKPCEFCDYRSICENCVPDSSAYRTADPNEILRLKELAAQNNNNEKDGE